MSEREERLRAESLLRCERMRAHAVALRAHAEAMIAAVDAERAMLEAAPVALLEAWARMCIARAEAEEAAARLGDVTGFRAALEMGDE
jgi:hypothetical protein